MILSERSRRDGPKTTPTDPKFRIIGAVLNHGVTDFHLGPSARRGTRDACWVARWDSCRPFLVYSKLSAGRLC